MEIHHTQKNEVAWSSWLPALGYALAASEGPVLEIGIGHFSTPFLHEYCKANGRVLCSVEGSLDWRNPFQARYSCKDHPFFLDTKWLPDWEDWGVVFIDDSPGGENRANHFRGFMNKADFIVVHDYWRDNEEAIKPLLEGVNYKVYSDYEPPTLIASLTHKLN